MESLVIRPFTPSDQDRVTEIFIDWNRHIAAPDTANAFETYIRRSITEEMGRIPEYYQAHPKSGFWVAETNGDVVGMVGIEHLSDDEAEVRRMYVDAGLRRRGIGAQLLTHAEAFCARAGYARIVLSTSALQQAAKALYEAKGYRLVREVVADEQTNRTVGGGIRRYHYVKELAGN